MSKRQTRAELIEALTTAIGNLIWLDGKWRRSVPRYDDDGVLTTIAEITATVGEAKVALQRLEKADD